MDFWYGCHGVLIMSINLKRIAVLNICSVDYCCTFNGISGNKSINFLPNADLSKKCIIIKYNFSSLYIKDR